MVISDSKKNIITLEECKEQLQQAGFNLCTSQDIIEHVLVPFDDWLSSRQVSARVFNQNRLAWLKYKVSARFLNWTYRNKILRYIVISALLFALKQGLGEEFTPELREAWSETYQVMAIVMRQAAYPSYNSNTYHNNKHYNRAA